MRHLCLLIGWALIGLLCWAFIGGAAYLLLYRNEQVLRPLPPHAPSTLSAQRAGWQRCEPAGTNGSLWICGEKGPTK